MTIVDYIIIASFAIALSLPILAWQRWRFRVKRFYNEIEIGDILSCGFVITTEDPFKTDLDVTMKYKVLDKKDGFIKYYLDNDLTRIDSGTISDLVFYWENVKNMRTNRILKW